MTTAVRVHMVEGMAGEIWTHVGLSGHADEAALEAAGDLATLFEQLNDSDLVDLAGRTGMRFERPVQSLRIGAWMAEAALDPSFAQEAQGAECARCWFVDFMQVPRFSVMIEGDDLVWEGDDPMGYPPSLVNLNPAGWPSGEVQSLLFDVDVFSVARARSWAREHGFLHGTVDTTAHYHRFRQFDPDGRPCRTIIFGDSGIKAVVCSTTRARDHREVH